MVTSSHHIAQEGGRFYVPEMIVLLVQMCKSNQEQKQTLKMLTVKRILWAHELNGHSPQKCRRASYKLLRSHQFYQEEHFCKLSTKNSKFLFRFNVRANKKVASLSIQHYVNWIQLAVIQSCRFDLWKMNGIDVAYHTGAVSPVLYIQVVTLIIITPESGKTPKIPDVVLNIKLCIYKYFICSFTLNKIDFSKK